MSEDLKDILQDSDADTKKRRNERFPVPRWIQTKKVDLQTRFLLARVNPFNTHHNTPLDKEVPEGLPTLWLSEPTGNFSVTFSLYFPRFPNFPRFPIFPFFPNFPIFPKFLSFIILFFLQIVYFSTNSNKNFAKKHYQNKCASLFYSRQKKRSINHNVLRKFNFLTGLDRRRREATNVCVVEDVLHV